MKRDEEDPIAFFRALPWAIGIGLVVYGLALAVAWWLGAFGR